MLEDKNKENTEESLESLPTSPLDPNWGKGLPAPTPVVAAPSTPLWRPWEEEEEKEKVNLSAAVQKRKRRSPAAAARSRRRLQQWQEKVDGNRLKSELRTTPLRSAVQMRGTRLLGRLEGQDGGIIHAGSGGSWVEGKTVFVSNQNQTSMLPQSFQSPMLTFAPVGSSPSIDCGGRLDVPNVVTLCPACRAWGLLTRT